MSYDPTTPGGQVRLLISDTDAGVFTDIEITAFLGLENQSVYRAAAQALDTIASNEVLVSKVITTQDLQTDGSKVSAELRARAAVLRQQADNVNPDGTIWAFDVVDFDQSRWWLPANEQAEEPEQ